MIDIDAIRQRWTGAHWRYTEAFRADGVTAVIIINDDLRIAEQQATRQQCAALQLAAQAPDDVRALLAELEAAWAVVEVAKEHFALLFEDSTEIMEVHDRLEAALTAYDEVVKARQSR